MSKQILEYKGFQGSVEFSLENNILYGKILHIDDLVSYEADDVKGIYTSFTEAIDDYLETCEELGVPPNRQFSGSFNVRIGSQLHREATKQSTREDKSLNEWVRDAIECHLHGRHQEVHHHYPKQESSYVADMFIHEAPVTKRVHLRAVQ